jgi:hypothetical protein
MRVVNESSSSESDLLRARLMKIRAELMKCFELKNLIQTRLVIIRASS